MGAAADPPPTADDGEGKADEDWITTSQAWMHAVRSHFMFLTRQMAGEGRVCDVGNAGSSADGDHAGMRLHLDHQESRRHITKVMQREERGAFCLFVFEKCRRIYLWSSVVVRQEACR